MFFKKKPKLNNPDILKFVNHRAVKYVTTRGDDDIEYVIGKSGIMSISGDELVIFCNAVEVFRCDIYKAEMGELLSHDGVRIKSTDHNGKTQSVVAYYTFRR